MFCNKTLSFLFALAMVFSAISFPSFADLEKKVGDTVVFTVSDVQSKTKVNGTANSVTYSKGVSFDQLPKEVQEAITKNNKINSDLGTSFDSILNNILSKQKDASVSGNVFYQSGKQNMSLLDFLKSCSKGMGLDSSVGSGKEETHRNFTPTKQDIPQEAKEQICSDFLGVPIGSGGGGNVPIPQQFFNNPGFDMSAANDFYKQIVNGGLYDKDTLSQRYASLFGSGLSAGLNGLFGKGDQMTGSGLNQQIELKGLRAVAIERYEKGGYVERIPLGTYHWKVEDDKTGETFFRETTSDNWKSIGFNHKGRYRVTCTSTYKEVIGDTYVCRQLDCLVLGGTNHIVYAKGGESSGERVINKEDKGIKEKTESYIVNVTDIEKQKSDYFETQRIK